MLILTGALLAIASVPATGGRLSRLAALRWRAWWLLPITFLVQLAVLEVPGLPEGGAAAVHTASYALAGVFVALNLQRVRGLWLLALGAASNGVTIALNGGTLPSSASARSAAGITTETTFVNSGSAADPVLGFLGDVFAWPAPLPLANVFSVGDVAIVAGAFWVLLAAGHHEPWRAGARRSSSHRPARAQHARQVSRTVATVER